MSSVSTTNISGTDHDFDRPSGTGVSLYRYPGTSYLATIMLSLRDKIHSSAEALLKLTLMERIPTAPSVYQTSIWRQSNMYSRPKCRTGGFVDSLAQRWMCVNRLFDFFKGRFQRDGQAEFSN